MVNLIGMLIVLGVVLYLVRLIPMPSSISRIILIVGVVIAVLWVLQAFNVIHTVAPMPRVF